MGLEGHSPPVHTRHPTLLNRIHVVSFFVSMGRMLRDPFLRALSYLTIFTLFFNPIFVSALGQKKIVSFEQVDGSIDLVARGQTAALLLDDKGLYTQSIDFQPRKSIC